MKLFNIYKKKVLIHLLICFLALLLWFIYLNKITIIVNTDLSLSIWDLIIYPDATSLIDGNGALGKKSVAIPITIMFILLVISNISFDSGNYIILREKSRVDFWKKQSKRIVMISFLYSVIVVLEAYVISGVMIGDFTNRWCSKQSIIYYTYGNTYIFDKLTPYLNTGLLLGIIFVGLFLGLTCIGLLVGFLKTKFKSIYIFMAMGGIILYETMYNYSIIISKMTIDIKYFLKPEIIIVNYLFLILIGTISYVCGKKSIIRKDFIHKSRIV